MSRGSPLPDSKQRARDSESSAVSPTPVFETYPLPRADTAKHGVSAISRAHLNTRIRRRIRLSRIPSRPAASRATPWISAADHGGAKAKPGRARERPLRDAVRGVGSGREAPMLCSRFHGTPESGTISLRMVPAGDCKGRECRRRRIQGRRAAISRPIQWPSSLVSKRAPRPR